MNDILTGINNSDNDPIHFDAVPSVVVRNDIDKKWPVITNHAKKLQVSYINNSGQMIGAHNRRFKALRICSGSNRSNDRFHVGIDLYGYAGDKVIACESGIIVNHHRFLSPNHALLVKCDSGIVINYGEVEDDSWLEFGLDIGSRVEAGQTIARIGQAQFGSMLHLEIYTRETTQTSPWFQNQTRPTNVLDPSAYLINLAKSS